jgi:hypothetical protein
MKTFNEWLKDRFDERVFDPEKVEEFAREMIEQHFDSVNAALTVVELELKKGSNNPGFWYAVRDALTQIKERGY